MDQNQTVDNDLQKAIDDITNTTSADPVFSDPVAAPSSVPEGDTGELDESVGPFPEPEIEIVPPPATETITPPPSFDTPNPTTSSSTTDNFSTTSQDVDSSLSAKQIKEAALRDLAPILDQLTLEPAQKFNLYRNILENLKDFTVLESAYNTAKEIPNNSQRAEALLYLVESID